MAEEITSAILPVVNPFPTRGEEMVLRAEGLLKLGGDDKLSPADRQDAVLHLMSVRPDLNNVELGRIFKVNEKTIRKDKEEIKNRLSEEMSDRDISVVISDLLRGHQVIMLDLDRSLAQSTRGTAVYLSHLRFKHEANFRIVEVLQSLGVYPKNLGNLSKTEFVFKAHVAKGGGVNVMPVATREELKTIEATEAKLLPGVFESDEDRLIREQLAEEFSDTPKDLPALSSGSAPTR